jgi:hypothetical protein
MRSRLLLIALALSLFAPDRLSAITGAGAKRPGLFLELSAGPLLGLDRPIRGGAGDLAVGLACPPFEGGLRAGAAYDASLDQGLLRFDMLIGLGSGLRAIVGALLPLGSLSLSAASNASGAPVGIERADWPDRFGIGATLAELPWRPFGAGLSIDSELIFTEYRASSPTAVTGAAAFAASVEAKLALRLRFGTRSQR